jgi:hypothetical protein
VGRDPPETALVTGPTPPCGYRLPDKWVEAKPAREYRPWYRIPSSLGIGPLPSGTKPDEEWLQGPPPGWILFQPSRWVEAQPTGGYRPTDSLVKAPPARWV